MWYFIIIVPDDDNDDKLPTSWCVRVCVRPDWVRARKKIGGFLLVEGGGGGAMGLKSKSRINITILGDWCRTTSCGGDVECTRRLPESENPIDNDRGTTAPTYDNNDIYARARLCAGLHAAPRSCDEVRDGWAAVIVNSRCPRVSSHCMPPESDDRTTTSAIALSVSESCSCWCGVATVDDHGFRHRITGPTLHERMCVVCARIRVSRIDEIILLLFIYCKQRESEWESEKEW